MRRIVGVARSPTGHVRKHERLRDLRRARTAAPAAGLAQYLYLAAIVIHALQASTSAAPVSIVIGGTFQMAQPEGATLADVFAFAVAEANRTLAPPGVELAPLVADQGLDSSAAVGSAVTLAAAGAAVVVGLRTSAAAQPMSYALNNYALPHISITASAPTFSNKAEYPLFARVVPSDSLQGSALAEVLAAFGWRRVAIAYTADVYGEGIAASFAERAAALNLTLAASASFFPSGDPAPALAELRAAQARVVVLAMLHADAGRYMAAAAAAGAAGDRYAYLCSDSLAVDTSLVGKPAAALAAMDGMLGVRTYAGAPSSEAQAALSRRWAAAEAARGAASPRAVPYYGLFTWDAVQAAARALAALSPAAAASASAAAAAAGTGPGGLRTLPVGRQLFAALVGVGFEGATGPVSFTPAGDRVGAYELVNLRAGAWRRIATFDPSRGLEPRRPPAAFFGGRTDPPSDLLSCPAGTVPEPTGSSCEPCPAGTFAPAGAAACTPCPAGSTAAAAGSPACTPCTPGRFQDREGQSSCVPPDPGFYVPYPAASNPLPCPALATTRRPGAVRASECFCARSTYALAPFGDVAGPDARCLPCPEGAQCDGPLPPRALPGFYEAPWDRFVGFERCPEAPACAGGAAPAAEALLAASQNQSLSFALAPPPEACAEGYAGPLCSVCTEGYGRSGSFKCAPCFSVAATWFIVAAGVVVITAGALLLLVRTVKTALRPAARGFVLIKILLSYAQLLSYSKFATPWSAALDGFFAAVSTGVSPLDTVFSPDCALRARRGSVPFGDRLFVVVAAPGACLLVALAVFLADRFSPRARRLLSGPGPAVPPAPGRHPLPASPSLRYHAGLVLAERALEEAARREAERAAARKLSSSGRRFSDALHSASDAAAEFYVPSAADYFCASALLGVFLLHPMITETVLLAFRCTPVRGRRLLHADMRLDCGSDEYRRSTLALALPALVSHVLLMAYVPFAWLFLRRKAIFAPHLRTRFAFLTRGYRLRAVYWEAFAVTRKILVVVIAVFLSEAPSAQALVAIGALVATTVVTARVQPYEFREANVAEVAAASAVTLTVFAGAFLTTTYPPEDQRRSVSAAVLALNCAFVAMWAFYFLREARPRLAALASRLWSSPAPSRVAPAPPALHGPLAAAGDGAGGRAAPRTPLGRGGAGGDEEEAGEGPGPRPSAPDGLAVIVPLLPEGYSSASSGLSALPWGEPARTRDPSPPPPPGGAAGPSPPFSLVAVPLHSFSPPQGYS